LAHSKTTISLNGKLYDARTGKMIDGSTSTVPHATVNKKPAQSNGVVDGFVRRAPATTQPVKAKPAQARTTPTHLKSQPQKSQTLMRPAVKKPAPVTKRVNDISKHTIVKKQDPIRAQRAANVAKNTAITRYGAPMGSGGVTKHIVEHLPVAPAPTTTQKVAQLATSTEATVKHSVDAIEASLRTATSHLQQFEGKIAKKHFLERHGLRNKYANVGSFIVVSFLLVGFFAWQNGAYIQTKVAATTSGVSAQIPSYKPAGFSVSSKSVESEPGKVSIRFTSNTDDKQFTLTQQTSNWSSESLLANHVLGSGKTYQTYQEKGRTIFIFDNSAATWVSGGVWYSIDGNASLTSDQLLRIASSL
jgi:Domain of unknown function (DUF4367)